MPSMLSYPFGLITAFTALAVSLIGAWTSLTGSRRRFSADVLATNRQRWIETFRDRLSELLAVMNAAQVLKREAAGEWRGATGQAKDNPALPDKLEKTFLAIAQIQLLTNAADREHGALNQAISTAVHHLQQDGLHEPELSECWRNIIDLGRSIIQQEADRVKRGV
ncbi:MAG: hypothetical protein ACXW3O_06470 [Brevundimonas sp.]